MSRVRWPIPSHDPSPLAPVVTRLVTPVDPAEDVLTNELRLDDIFTRTVVDGWGRSRSGHDWANGVSHEAGSADVDGQRGTFNIATIGNRAQQLTDLGSRYAEIIFLWSFSAVPTGNLNRIEFALGANSTPTQGHSFRIENNSGGNIRIACSDTTISGDFTVTNSYVHGDEWWVRANNLDGKLKIKAWKLGSEEPATWQFQDVISVLPAGTFIMIGGQRFSTPAVTFTIDSVEAKGAPQTVAGISESVSETLTNSAESTQSLLSAEAQEANNSGTGSFTVADATAETVTNISGPAGYGEEEYGDGYYVEFQHTLLEAIGESPINEIALIDTFSRTVVNGWGVSDSNYTWSIWGGAGTAEVDGSVGKVGRSGGGERTSFIVTDYRHQEGIVKVSVNPLPDISETSISFQGRDSVGTSTTSVSVGLRVGSTGVLVGRLFVNNSFKDLTITSSYIAGDEYFIKWEFVENLFNFKSWKVGDSEPANWQITTRVRYDIDIVRFYGGVSNGSGMTSDPVWSVDNLNVKFAPRSITSSLSDILSDDISNSSSGSQSGLEAEAQDILNEATAVIAIDEVIVGAPAPKVVIHRAIPSHSFPEKVAITYVTYAFAVSSLEITDTLTNESTSSQTLLSAEAQAINETGQGSFTVADATAETTTNSGTSSQTFLEGLADTVSNVATSTQSLLDAFADFLTNASTAVISILSAEAQAINNSGSGSFTTADATAETVNNSATGVISIFETISGNVIETLDNVATSVQTILSAEAQEANNAGTGSFTVADATAETISNSGVSSLTIQEAVAETFTNSATNVPAIVSADIESLVNSGQAVVTDSEATAEAITNSQLAVHSIVENTTICLSPISDISTGTWHDTPLWEKVNEATPIGGFPTEAIHSGEDPINDTAVLGIEPGSDPQQDIDHYINVQFYKLGSPADEVDFIIRVKQGNTVIATRTFVDVQELSSAPRTERIGLTTGEVANITNYGDLRFEIVANKTN